MRILQAIAFLSIILRYCWLYFPVPSIRVSPHSLPNPYACCTQAELRAQREAHTREIEELCAERPSPAETAAALAEKQAVLDAATAQVCLTAVSCACLRTHRATERAHMPSIEARACASFLPRNDFRAPIAACCQDVAAACAPRLESHLH